MMEIELKANALLDLRAEWDGDDFGVPFHEFSLLVNTIATAQPWQTMTLQRRSGPGPRTADIEVVFTDGGTWSEVLVLDGADAGSVSSTSVNVTVVAAKLLEVFRDWAVRNLAADLVKLEMSR
jgi:hypothetical protein